MTNQTRKGDWIQTVSGIQFWPLDPRPDEILIEDIAHALSNQCRFSGHTKFHYSVAQHSILVSLACDAEDALWGLLHDASEAYLVDFPRPIKQLEEFSIYYKVESLVMKTITDKYGLPLDMPASVKEADETLLATEARDLLPNRHPDFHHVEANGFKVLPEKIESWGQSYAKLRFLQRFYQLKK